MLGTLRSKHRRTCPEGRDWVRARQTFDGGLGRGAAGAQLLPVHPPHSPPAEVAPGLAQPDCVGHGDSGWLVPGDAPQNSLAVESLPTPPSSPLPRGSGLQGGQKGRPAVPASYPLSLTAAAQALRAHFCSPLLCIYRCEPELARVGGGEGFRALK